MLQLAANFSRATAIRLGSATLALAALCISAVPTAYASPNLIVNGSFSNPSVGGGWSAFGNGSVPGWTNTGSDPADGIEIDGPGPIGGSAYPGTTQSAELDGTTWDTISQTVTGLTVGDEYVLSWAYGQRPGSGYQEANVSFGGDLITTDISSGTVGTLTWTLNTFDVVATATTENLQFAAVAGLGNPSIGNEITAVSLTDSGVAVPEPITLVLIAAGALGMGLSRRHKA